MSNLPDEMPQKWKDAIKSAAAPKWWVTVITTILGSSLIAGGISFCGDNYRDKQNANREAKKELQKETIASYGDLGKKIQDFQTSIQTAIVVFQRSVNSNDKSEDKIVQSSRADVGFKIGGVVSALNAPRITDQGIKLRVGNLFAELPQLLAQSQKDKKELAKVIKLWIDKLQPQTEAIKNDIETIRNNVPLDPQ